MNSWLHWIDLAGIAVFAISGTLMAHEKKVDGFGVIVLATVTAIGGGTLRDVMLDLPVFWVKDASFFYVILVSAGITIFWLRSHKRFPHAYLLYADALGLAFFNVMGLEKALTYGASPFTAIIFGTMTGCFGGLIRDVICREIPLVLKGELYATTCIAGGLAFILGQQLGLANHLCLIAGFSITLVMRLMAMRWQWHLVVFK